MKIRAIKSLIVFVVSIFTLVFFTTSVGAASLSPSSGNIATTGETTISIIATNTSNSSATVNLDASNLTVLGVGSGPNTLILQSGYCGGSQYTSTRVCLDIAKTGGADFTSGEVMATFRVRSNSTSQATVTSAASAEYLDGTPINASGTYNTSGGTLPNTAIGDSGSQTLFLGFAALSIGVISALVIILRQGMQVNENKYEL